MSGRTETGDKRRDGDARRWEIRHAKQTGEDETLVAQEDVSRRRNMEGARQKGDGSGARRWNRRPVGGTRQGTSRLVGRSQRENGWRADQERISRVSAGGARRPELGRRAGSLARDRCGMRPAEHGEILPQWRSQRRNKGRLMGGGGHPAVMTSTATHAAYKPGRANRGTEAEAV